MRLSTKGRYSVRAMFHLALYHRERAVSLRHLSEKEDISLDYLEQLFRRLKAKGLIKSVRGPKGGFLLARKPSEIKIGDIIRGVGEPVSLVHCIDEKEDTNPCSQADECVPQVLWKRIGNKIAEVLDTTTLNDLCREAK